jgi:hypothetical protein
MKKTAKPSRTPAVLKNVDMRAVLGGGETPQDPDDALLEKTGDRASQAMDGYIRG